MVRAEQPWVNCHSRMCLGHGHELISSCALTRRNRAWRLPLVRALVTLTVAMVGIRSDGDAVCAREHALVRLGLVWYVMEDEDELPNLDEVLDFSELRAEVLEARAWSPVASRPWNDFENMKVLEGPALLCAGRHPCDHSPPNNFCALGCCARCACAYIGGHSLGFRWRREVNFADAGSNILIPEVSLGEVRCDIPRFGVCFWDSCFTSSF